MIGGIIWGWDYINSLNTEWFGYPTLCGIFCICICLTAVVIVLNVITTIVAYQYTDNKATSTNEPNQEKQI